MTPLRQRMIEDLTVRNYAPKTIKIYVAAVAAFAKFAGRSPDQLGPEDVRRWQLHLIKEKRLSASGLNTSACALRFFYRVTLGADWKPESIPYAKRPKTLPKVLSQREVLLVLSKVKDPMFRVALMTAYAAGLRISEVRNLKVEDIDSERMLIHVRQGKGRKDRVVPLSKHLLEMLREYWRAHQPELWLFPSRMKTKSQPISAHRLNDVLREAGAELGKHVTTHAMRHAFATHLIETGHDIRTVQALLGHRRLDTTQRYNHVARHEVKAVRSPLDMVESDDLMKKLYKPQAF